MSVVWLEKNGVAQCTNGHLNHTRGLGRFLEDVTWALRSEKMTSYCAPLALLPEPATLYSMWLTIMGAGPRQSFAATGKPSQSETEVTMRRAGMLYRELLCK